MTAIGNILIIDDEASLLNTLSRILQKVGCSVIGAANGAEALRLLSNSPFDLVYLDLWLPDMNGLQVLQEIRKSHPKLPVILLTAHGSMDTALKAMRLGATDYLIKPIDPEQLISHTRSMLKIQEIERRRKEIQLQITTLQEELRLLDGENPPPIQSTPSPPLSDMRFIRHGLLSVDIQARRITFDEKEIPLPPSSFDYFLVLTRHAPDTVPFQMLVTEAQGYQVGLSESRALARWHVHVIRQAFEVDPTLPRILNERGQGYRLILD